ncbi:MAG: hypothetical protein IKI75_06700 [Lachnospiraceae bacterium]|nr:hypothetical protein [Lachnospiraceae bacterium]
MANELGYEQFIHEIIKKVMEEYSVTEEQVRFHRKGLVSEDPRMLEWIRNSNELYCGKDSDILLKDFLTVEISEDEDIASINRVDAEALYADYMEKGMDHAYSIVRDGQEELKRSGGNNEAVRLRGMRDYESIKEQLIIRPLNYSLHARELKGCVYRKFSDFVFVLYQRMSDSEGTLITSKIKRDELKDWGYAEREEEVLEDAMLNTMRLYPASVYDYRINEEVEFLEGDFTRKDITMAGGLMGNHILMSTLNCTNGAIALFYPGVVEKMMEIMGGPFNAVLMNINDILVFDLKDPQAKNFAKQAGKSGKMGEMLSAKIYMCDENGINPAAQFFMMR